MARQVINIGQRQNDRTGDSWRTAATKINEMTDELYAATAGIPDVAGILTVDDLVTNLTTTEPGSPLDATQGKELKDAIDAILGGAGAPTVVNDLTTGGTTAALSAQQGVVLKGITDALDTRLDTAEADIDALETSVTGLGTVLTGTTRPAAAPASSFSRYLDTASGIAYAAVGTATSSDWRRMTLPNTVAYLDEEGLSSGADITDKITAVLSRYPSGVVLVLKPGSYNVRYKNIILNSNQHLRAEIPGSVTLNGVTGGATVASANDNTIISVAVPSQYVSIQGINFNGANPTYYVVRTGNQISDFQMRDCNVGKLAAFRMGLPAWSLMTTGTNTGSRIIIDNVHGVGDTSIKGNQFITIGFAFDWVVSNCTASNYQHGVQWWGGNAASEGGSGGTANERKCGDGLVYGCRFTDMGTGGAGVPGSGAAIWGSMGRRIQVINNFAARCGDVCLDAEGCEYTIFDGNEARDANNAICSVFFGAVHVYFRNNILRFTDLTSWSASGRARYFGSWNSNASFQLIRFDENYCTSPGVTSSGNYPSICDDLGETGHVYVRNNIIDNGTIQFRNRSRSYVVDGNRITLAAASTTADWAIDLARTFAFGEPHESRYGIFVRDNIITISAQQAANSGGIRISHYNFNSASPNSNPTIATNVLHGNTIYSTGTAWLTYGMRFVNEMTATFSQFYVYAGNNIFPRSGTPLSFDDGVGGGLKPVRWISTGRNVTAVTNQDVDVLVRSLVSSGSPQTIDLFTNTQTTRFHWFYVRITATGYDRFVVGKFIAGPTSVAGDVVIEREYSFTDSTAGGVTAVPTFAVSTAGVLQMTLTTDRAVTISARSDAENLFPTG